MSEPAHIVVVDDEPDIRATFKEYLELHGYRVSQAAEGGALLERDPADLILLDLNMPGEDGLKIARSIRERSAVGIIMVTALGDTIDRVIGLEMGADDYVPKPVDLRELLARVKSVLWRTRGRGRAKVEAAGDLHEINLGLCRLDLDGHRLFDASGAEVPLTAMEYDLLKAFADNPNRVLSRDRLLELAHSRDSEPFDRAIDIRIMRLRRKIEPDPGNPVIIRTVRGAGYMFVPGG